MNFAYVVFNMPPENLKIFKFPIVDPISLQFFKSLHNLYVNATDFIPKEQEDFLIAMSEGKHDFRQIYDDTDPNVDFKKLEIHNENVQLIVCGFVL